MQSGKTLGLIMIDTLYCRTMYNIFTYYVALLSPKTSLPNPTQSEQSWLKWHHTDVSCCNDAISISSACWVFPQLVGQLCFSSSNGHRGSDNSQEVPGFPVTLEVHLTLVTQELLECPVGETQTNKLSSHWLSNHSNVQCVTSVFPVVTWGTTKHLAKKQRRKQSHSPRGTNN